MIEMIKTLFEHKSIALLGFGREGKSTYKLFRNIFPLKTLTLIDENNEVRYDVLKKDDANLLFITGKGCMNEIDNFDIAVKSPGIPSNILPDNLRKVQITSQTDIFLHLFGKQVIGITGTKGKSTTSSLVSHILKKAERKVLFVGNIGIPPFNCIDEITPETGIVMELSSHQLEYLSHSPHIAILLNVFQEHLDHYQSYLDYQLAKLNIGRYQNVQDYFIYNTDNETLVKLVENIKHTENKKLAFSLNPDSQSPIRLTENWIELFLEGAKTNLYNISEGQPLKGHHNLYNIMAAATACFLVGVSTDHISSGVKSFSGLEHRIEAIGLYNGILWYNDSIATIPEATIEAVKTLHTVNTLILGGFDRGIDYSVLYPFLNNSEISNLIFVGDAGRRIKKELSSFGIKASITVFEANDYQEVVKKASEVTQKGKICLLSPAAASYDMFSNFEERGNTFKKNVRELSPSHGN